MNPEELLISKISNNILDVIENKDQFTTSDLQGAITAQVMNAVREAKSL